MKNTPPDDYIPKELKEVFAAIESGMFGHVEELKALIDTIRFNNDQLININFKKIKFTLFIKK